MKTSTKRASLIRSLFVLALALIILPLGQAQAAIQNYSISGQILAADAGNFFNATSVPQSISGSLSFDDAALISDGNGGQVADVSTLSVSIGSVDFDISNALWTPSITFFSDSSIGLDFAVDDFLSNGSDFDFVALNFFAPTDFWEAYTFDSFTFQQVMVSGNYTITAVPVPGALVLFGSALIGFVSISRRRRV